MTFTKSIPRVPTSIGMIEITLYKDENTQGANYKVSILDQNGAEIRVVGDIGNLVPHLSQADISWLLDFMSRIRTKAGAEFL